MTTTQRATRAAAATAVIAMVLLIAATVSGNAPVTTLGIAALVAVPAARNLVVVVDAGSSPRERVLALVGIALILVVGAAVWSQRP